MKISFNGFGEKVVTFEAADGVTKGSLVKNYREWKGWSVRKGGQILRG